MDDASIATAAPGATSRGTSRWTIREVALYFALGANLCGDLATGDCLALAFRCNDH